MRIKPILFNTEMARAILDGRKTQTRRLIKPAALGLRYEDSAPAIKPPVEPGDILWVRETWKQATTGTAGPGLIDLFLYKADDPQDTTGMMVEERWHPSIHMPRRAARIFLEVKAIRAERLKDITEADVQAEGTDMDAWYEYDEWQHQVGDGCVSEGIPVKFETMRGFFGHTVWDTTMQSREQYEKYGWDANPWVWVIEFERIDGGRKWISSES